MFYKKIQFQSLYFKISGIIQCHFFVIIVKFTIENSFKVNPTLNIFQSRSWSKTTQIHIIFCIIFSNNPVTSSVDLAKVRESPDVPESHGESDAGQQILDLIVPFGPLLSAGGDAGCVHPDVSVCPCAPQVGYVLAQLTINRAYNLCIGWKCSFKSCVLQFNV